MLSRQLFQQVSRLSTSRILSADFEVTEASPNVFHVELNRPEKRNTFALEQWMKIGEIFDGLSKNPKCRAIVLSGRGKSFCAGINLQEGFAEIMGMINNEELDIARKGRKVGEYIQTAQDGYTAIEKCIKPVIVAIHSHCIGAGIDMITACDIRYATTDATFSIKEVDVGLAADVGTLNRIQKVVSSDSLTRELALTARDFTADEALNYGLVSSLCPDREAVIKKALNTAAIIAEKSPIAVQGTKLHLNYSRDHSVRESLDYIKVWNQSQLLSEDLLTAGMASMQKQKATFKDVDYVQTFDLKSFSRVVSRGKMFNTGKFAGKTAIISGASRGIGKEIALKLAKDGANIVVAAKTTTPHPKLPGTIFTAAEEIEKAGGKALPFPVDVRDEKSVSECVQETVKKFGGVDILINNASAISLTGTLDTEMKRFDLMHQINTRGTFLLSKTCLPYLKQAKNPHILNISPPLIMDSLWFRSHVAYTMAKYGMSMCVLGMSEELRSDGIAVNALWPLTAIWTAAMDMLSSGEGSDGSRHPSIMADSAYAILSRRAKEYTGNFAIDEDILKEEGITDFERYAVKPGSPLIADYFLPADRLKQFQLTIDSSKNAKRSTSRNAISKEILGKEIEKISGVIQSALNEELVKKLNAIFVFNITGANAKSVTINLKEGAGSVTEAKPEKADVEFTCSDEDFLKLFTGELSALVAFSMKKLQIKGNMQKAIALEGLMKKMKAKM
ncbi:unnamed protein product, partial [Mesorhabditis belari]|uniref:Delta(3,5)-Delta(2,4)-dienoyl-CoA isomerase, mitochondrial n=1 Tax=Mesorhabditis belari TaxID=2138241 RepID=A0AAF3F4V1_9BILA